MTRFSRLQSGFQAAWIAASPMALLLCAPTTALAEHAELTLSNQANERVVARTYQFDQGNGGQEESVNVLPVEPGRVKSRELPVGLHLIQVVGATSSKTYFSNVIVVVGTIPIHLVVPVTDPGPSCGSGTDNPCPFGYVCESGICVPPKQSCAPGDPNSCPSGEYCDDSTDTCQPQLPTNTGP